MANGRKGGRPVAKKGAKTWKQESKWKNWPVLTDTQIKERAAHMERITRDREERREQERRRQNASKWPLRSEERGDGN